MTRVENSMDALRLWQLISPVLPVGAYSYSQGLEYAVERGWVRCEVTAGDWIGGQMRHSLAALDVPLVMRLHAAWSVPDERQVEYWNAFLLASRETSELKAEDLHMGGALARLLPELGVAGSENLLSGDTAFATVFSLAAVRWHIDAEQAVRGYLWAWCENQVMAAVKLIPLGQTAGQRLLFELGGRIPEAVEYGFALDDDDIGRVNPRAALASSLHERQYTRLFRS